MKIIIDSREQSKLKFKHTQITEVIIQKLDVGDYGCRFENGHEPLIYFERKNIADLFGTLSKDYDRFKREIIRAHEAKITMFIIVEGTLTDVLKGHKYSKRKGISIVTQLFTIMVRYGVKTIYCKDRTEMAKYITEFYLCCGREYLRQLGVKRLTNGGGS